MSIKKIILTLVLTTAGLFAAAEDFQYPYTAANARDPFAPLVNDKGEILIREIKETGNLEIFTVNGIIYSPGDSIAIINGEMFLEGDNMGGYAIKKIEPNMVILELEGKEYFLKWEE